MEEGVKWDLSASSINLSFREIFKNFVFYFIFFLHYVIIVGKSKDGLCESVHTLLLLF